MEPPDSRKMLSLPLSPRIEAEVIPTFDLARHCTKKVGAVEIEVFTAQDVAQTKVIHREGISVFSHWETGLSQAHRPRHSGRTEMGYLG